jgi:2-(1,2-epoxy-1,2-dihydrophenyl)acetyl-CoA isomerase
VGGDRVSAPLLVEADSEADSSTSGAVVRLTLARPEAGNALDGALAAALLAAFDDVAAQAADGGPVRCVLLLAQGRNFCVGGDVRTFASAGPGPGPQERVGALAAAFHTLQRRILDLPVPVVVGAHGWVAGAGIGLALCGDVVVLGASARLRPAYLGIGLSPDGGASWFLTRGLGAARARDVLLTDGFVTADEALAAGLVSRVVPDDHVGTVAAQVATAVAAGPAGAVRRTRALVRAAQTGSDLLAHLDAEAAAIAACAGEPDGVEGVRAFLERRPPRFG